MTLKDILQYVQAYTNQLDEKVLQGTLVLEYARQSVNTIQDNFPEYFYPTFYKTVSGEGTSISYPSDIRDSMISEMVVQSGKGEPLSATVTCSATGGITFKGREPKADSWTVTFIDDVVSSATVNPANKTIAIGHHSVPTGDEAFATTNQHIVSLLNADATFLEYFVSATAVQPSQEILDAIGFIVLSGGSGNGWRKCYYLPQSEYNSTLYNTLTSAKAELCIYYMVKENLAGNKVISILPVTQTHYLMQYVRQVNMSTVDTELQLPKALEQMVVTDVLMKVYDSFVNQAVSEELKKEYMMHFKSLKAQYNDYLKQLTASSVGRSTPIKN